MTVMDVFSRHLFAYPIANKNAKTLAKDTIIILSKHAFLPTTNFSDKGSTFVSQEIKEISDVRGITIQHATTKHTQMIWLLEQNLASLKKALKIETCERRSIWHKYVNKAVLKYNTSYYTSIGRKPKRVVRGRVPYHLLCVEMAIDPQKPIYTQFLDYPGRCWTNTDDSPWRTLKRHSSSHQVQSLLRRKTKHL